MKRSSRNQGVEIKRIVAVRVFALLALSISLWIIIAVALGGVIYRRGSAGTASATGTPSDGLATGSDAWWGDGPGYFALYIEGDPIDLDGDGMSDGWAVDTDGDGIPDGVDFDGDGAADPFDLDLDGVADGLDFDLDGDGVYDTYGFMVAELATPSTASDAEGGPGVDGSGYVDSGPGAAGTDEEDEGLETLERTYGAASPSDGGDSDAASEDDAASGDDGSTVLAALGISPLGGLLGGGLLPAATPSFALLGAHLPHVGGSEVWVYEWKHTPLFDDDGIPPLDPYVWGGANAGQVPDADPDDPDTCPGLYEVLTHDEYDGYTVYLMADIMIPGGTTAAAGVEVAAGITSITIDGVWPAVDPDDYDGDGIPDEVDDDLDGDGIPNATYDGDGLILTLDMQLAGAHTLSQETNMSIFGSGYDALYGNTTGRFFTIRVTHLMDFFRLQNMDAYARVAEGMVWVQPGLTCEGTMLEYSNVNFTGPQMVYNIDGGASFRNVNIMMDGPDIGRTGDTHGGFGCKQEVAQLCTADFYGYFNVHHDTDDTTHYYHVFFFYPDTDIYSGDPAAGNGGLYYMRFHENANVHVVSDNMSLTWFDTNRAGAGHTNGYIDYSNLDMYLEEGAQFWYTGYSGFTRKAFDSEIDQFEMEPGSRMDVHILGTPNADEYPGFPLTGTAHIREGAHLTFRNDVSIYPDADWALVGDETEGYGRGNWDIDGGVVQFIQNGDITNSTSVTRHFIRQKGFSITNGGIFEVKQVGGRFDLASPCVVLGTDGLYLEGDGSSFECVMRNSRVTSEGIRCYGPIYVGGGANFSYEVRNDDVNPYSPSIRSLIRMMGGSAGAAPPIVVDDPQSFVLASIAGRLIEFSDYPGLLDISGEQVNYWTTLPAAPTPPTFPARPTEHYMNADSDLYDPLHPEQGRAPVHIAGTLAKGTGNGNGWTISTVYYTGTNPAAINTFVFSNNFNTVRALSAGRMFLTTDPYFADMGLELTGQTLDDASVHVVADPYDPNLDDYNATPYQFLSDFETGEFAERIDTIHAGDKFWVLASKNFLFIEVWQVAQYAALPKVVYVDGTLTDPLADGSDPDGPGRGGTPANPVRTLKRAMEILELSGGHVIYVVGSVTLAANTSITGDGTDITYADTSDTVVIHGPHDQIAGTYDGVDTLEIRRFVKPTAGLATIGGSPNPDFDEEYDVEDFTGALLQLNGPGSPTLAMDHVTIDGSALAFAGEYWRHVTYMVDENGDVVYDAYNDPVVADVYEIPMAKTEVTHTTMAAAQLVNASTGTLALKGPMKLRNNYVYRPTNTGAGGAIAMYANTTLTTAAGAGGEYVEIYGNTVENFSGGAIMAWNGTTLDLCRVDIHDNAVSNHRGGALYLAGATQIHDALIHGNSAPGSTGYGGAIYNTNTGALTVYDAKLYDNRGGQGATICNDGTLNLSLVSGTYTEIYGALGTSSGQVIYNGFTGTANIAYAYIHDNGSTSNGYGPGAIYNLGTLTVDDGEFCNYSFYTEYGFLVNGAGGAATINGGKFHHNAPRYANRTGAAIFAMGGTVEIKGGEFYQNNGMDGACIYIQAAGAVTMDGGYFHDNAATRYGGVVYNAGTFTYKSGRVEQNTAAWEGVFVYQTGDMYLDCPNPTATGLIDANQSIYLYSTTSGTIVDYYIRAKQLLTGGALPIRVDGPKNGRTVIDYDDAIPGVLGTGVDAQKQYYAMVTVNAGNNFYILSERTADISVLELKQVFPAFPVVYVDGTLPDTMGGQSTDAPGRGGTPETPVRTLKRAFEILKEAESYLVPVPDAGITDTENAIYTDNAGAPLETYGNGYANLIYIVGNVTVDKNTEIDTVSSGGGTHVYYLDAAMTAASQPRIELAAPNIRIRRYAKPVAGQSTFPGYDSRWSANSFMGEMFTVGDAPVGDTSQPRSQVTLRLGRGVDVDGHYEVYDHTDVVATYKDGVYWKVGYKRTATTAVTQAEAAMIDVRYDGKLLMGLDEVANPGAYGIADDISARLHHNYVRASTGSTLPFGGAVRNRGVVRMNSGIIEDNTIVPMYSSVQTYGGGIANVATGVTYMDALLRRNQAQYGGGMAFYGASGAWGESTDAGALIDANVATLSGGGIALMGGTSYHMKRGHIDHNDGYQQGGGVWVGNGSQFTTGGYNSLVVLDANHAWMGGGVYNSGTFNMNTCAMMNCYAQGPSLTTHVSGGGVYNTGTFNFAEGLIDGCVTRRVIGTNAVTGQPVYDNFGQGGAICSYGQTATATITGSPTISNCKAAVGGAILVVDTTFTIASGADPTIVGNQAVAYTFGTNPGFMYGNGDGGAVTLYDATFEMYGGSLLMNTATYYGGAISNFYGRSTVKLVGGSILYNEAVRGGGVYTGTTRRDLSGYTYALAEGLLEYGHTTFTGNVASGGQGNGVYQNGRMVMKEAVHNFGSDQDIYLLQAGSVGASPSFPYGDRVIEREAWGTTAGLRVQMANPYKGRDVVVYDTAYVTAPVDPQHDRYVLGSTVPTYLFLVQEAARSNVLELQNWQVFDVSVPEEYFIVMRNESVNNVPKAVPIGGVTSTDPAPVADADTDLVAPMFRIVNNGTFNVKVDVVGFVNRSAMDGVNTATYPTINLVSSSTAALLPAAAVNDLYLGIKGTSTSGNVFSALPATTLSGMGTVGALTLNLGTLQPAQFGEFEFVAAARDAFMEKYKDPSFPLSALATAKRDHIRTVVPGAQNTAANARQKWQMYFKLTRGN